LETEVEFGWDAEGWEIGCTVRVKRDIT